MMNATTSSRIASMISLGWSREEATWRINAMEAAERQGSSLAKLSGLVDGDRVIVDDYRGNLSEAVVVSGRLTVGGCLPSPGMVMAVVSKPYRLDGGDFNLRAILANGSVLTAHSPTGTRVWRDDAGNDVDFRSAVMAV